MFEDLPQPRRFRTGFKSLHNDRFVCMDRDVSYYLMANRDAYGPWEEFTFEELPDEPGVFTIRNREHKMWLYAHPIGPISPWAVQGATHTGDFDDYFKYRINVLSKPNLSGDPGSFAIKSVAFDKWIAADMDGGGTLMANRDAIGPWERFCFAGPFFSLAGDGDLESSQMS